jgi:hypothetical protein
MKSTSIDSFKNYFTNNIIIIHKNNIIVEKFTKFECFLNEYQDIPILRDGGQNAQ